VEAAESARATIVGTVESTTRLDESGFRATLQVDRLLAGDVGDAGTVAVGWEQFDAGRAVRFREGDRLLLALDRVPGHTLWVKRFPGRKGFVIGARFGAFLRDPDAATLQLLERYLALDAATRRAEAGVTALASLAARAHPVVALGAVNRLGAVPGLAMRLHGPGGETLSATLGDASRPFEVRAAILELAGERQLVPLRPAVATRATPGDPLEAPALSALARIDGGMPPAQVEELLQRDDGALRGLAVEHGGEAVTDAQLAWLLRNDRSADVRAASVRALLQRRGLDAIGDATPALFDSDLGVRGEAAVQVGALGPGAVPHLESLVPGRTAEDLTGVVVALRGAGATGVAVLQELARNDPDPKIRGLAATALGRPISH
jgi:hypothetical protein